MGLTPGDRRRAVRFWGFMALAWIVAACGPSHSAPPGPGEARGAVPDLRGHTVLVLPVQLRVGVPLEIQADAELAHALRSRGQGVIWVFPPEIDAALARSPVVQARTRDLPVGMFLRAEVERIGDPLYGDIRRLAALTGADVALIPVEIQHGEAGIFRIAAAILEVRTGRVRWYGVVEGVAGAVDDPGALASLADALAKTVLPLGSA